MPRYRSRRDVLMASGAAMAAGLAGCLGDDPDDDADDTDDVSPGDVSDDVTEEWRPDGPVTMMIPFGEGGGTDVYHRQIGPLAADMLGTTWRVENMTSAGGMEAIGATMQSEPNGQHLTAYNPPSTPITWFISEPPFDMQELTPVCTYANTTPAYLTYGQVEHEFEGLEDIVDRYNDGEFTGLAVQDTGGPTSIIALILRDDPNVDWGFENLITYSGTGPVASDLVGGDLDVAIASDTGAIPVMRDSPDTFDAYAYMHSEKSVFEPDLDIPTLPEVYDINLDFLAALDRIILGPPGMPDEIVSVWESTWEEALQHEETIEWSEQGDWPIGFSSAEDTAALLDDVFTQIPEQIDLDDFRAEFG